MQPLGHVLSQVETSISKVALFSCRETGRDTNSQNAKAKNAVKDFNNSSVFQLCQIRDQS